MYTCCTLFVPPHTQSVLHAHRPPSTRPGTICNEPFGVYFPYYFARMQNQTAPRQVFWLIHKLPVSQPQPNVWEAAQLKSGGTPWTEVYLDMDPTPPMRICVMENTHDSTSLISNCPQQSDCAFGQLRPIIFYYNCIVDHQRRRILRSTYPCACLMSDDARRRGQSSVSPAISEEPALSTLRVHPVVRVGPTLVSRHRRWSDAVRDVRNFYYDSTPASIHRVYRTVHQSVVCDAKGISPYGDRARVYGRGTFNQQQLAAPKTRSPKWKRERKADFIIEKQHAYFWFSFTRTLDSVRPRYFDGKRLLSMCAVLESVACTSFFFIFLFIQE